MNIKLEKAFDAWNKCDLTNDQLDYLISSITITIDVLVCMGGKGVLLEGLFSKLESMKNIRQQR